MLFMLEQQHYTLNKGEKSEIIINHPFEPPCIMSWDVCMCVCLLVCLFVCLFVCSFIRVYDAHFLIYIMIFPSETDF